MRISEQIKPKKKRTALKVFLCIVVLAAAAVAGVAVWQRENIQAVIDSRNYSQEEIESKITESKQKVRQSLEAYDLPVMRDFTFEEEEMIRKGEITVEEAMQNIMAEQVSDTGDAQSTSSSASGGGEDTAQTRASGEKNASTVLSGYITQLYQMKAYYIGQLGTVESEMRAVYVESGRDKSKIPSIISSYLPRVSAMESECDAKVSALIAQLKGELESIGADTSIANEIYDAYINEKALKKAYYLSLY